MTKKITKITTEELVKNINIDYNNKVIEITNKLAKAITIPKGDTYTDFMEIRAAHPDYSVKVIKREVKKSKNSTSKITYKAMHDYLERVHPEDVKKLEEMRDEVKIDKLTEKKTKVYSFFEIKSWFMETYGEEIAA